MEAKGLVGRAALAGRCCGLGVEAMNRFLAWNLGAARSAYECKKGMGR